MFEGWSIIDPLENEPSLAPAKEEGLLLKDLCSIDCNTKCVTVLPEEGEEDTLYILYEDGVYSTYEWDGEWKNVTNAYIPSGTKSLRYTSNGTRSSNVRDYAWVEVEVDVDNTFGPGDEGKVVRSGELVPQTTLNVDSNGEYDTTIKNKVKVNVPQGYMGGDLHVDGDLSVDDDVSVDGCVNAACVKSELFTIDIPDEDYDSGVKVEGELNSNLGTILKLTGYANGEEETNYRPVIRNIAEPNQNYDAANKKYVDDHVVVPNYHLVFLHPDGTVDSYASSLTWATISANLTSPLKADYLDIFWGSTRFYAKFIEITDVNNGDMKAIGEVEYNGIQRYMVFTLDTSNVLTTTNIVTFEDASNKVQSVVGNSSSTVKFPSTKAVFDEFQRKPVVIWEVDGVSVTSGLTALETDMSASPAWQLTGLDFSPFKRVKVHTRAWQGTGATASASTTPAMVLEILLDPRAAITAYGGNFLASQVIQKSNDRNRLATLCCAISADKTSFAVMRMTNLYGTGATNNSDVNAWVFLIEGYYD